MFCRLLLLLALVVPPASAASLPGHAPLDRTIVAGLVEDGLRATGIEGELRVLIEQPGLPLGNQEALATQIDLQGLRYDQARGRFSAVLVGTMDGTPRFQLPVHGRVEQLVEVAVLIRALKRGEQIGPGDLEHRMLPEHRLQRDSLTAATVLIGAEARRNLVPGRVLTGLDVGPPRLVRKGLPVRLIYADRGLRLTTLGTARDDGAYGEPVRVMNPESRQQIQGVATGPDEVTIRNLALPSTGY
jgi:flagella basal body P-ring formation protein FlgA